MENSKLDRYMEPPPRLVPVAEALPHLGGLALNPYVGDLPDEVELFAAEELKDAFDDRAAQEMLSRALSIKRVSERLGRGRIKPIGISRVDGTDKGEKGAHHTYLVVAYDYTANVAVEISLDSKGELVDIHDERYQPPPTDDEIEHAIQLARFDKRLTGAADNLVGMAIPYSGPANEFENRRVLEVLFGCRTARLPKYRAWVDLSTDSILFAGTTCECCDKDEEMRHE